MTTVKGSLAPFIVVAMMAYLAQAQAPVQFTYTQTDATTGSGTLTGMFDTTVVGGPGVLTFTGAFPTATVTQKGVVTTQPVPTGAVGYISGTNGGIAGAPIGVHIGFSGTVTLSASSGNDTYLIDVPMTLTSGRPMQWQVDAFEDNSSIGGTNNVGGSVTHVGWVGNSLDGHRHTGNAINWGASGAVAALATASFNLGGEGAGDNLGITAGASAGTLNADSVVFVDRITLLSTQGPGANSVLNADLNTLRVVVPEPDSILIWGLLALPVVGFVVFRRRR